MKISGYVLGIFLCGVTTIPARAQKNNKMAAPDLAQLEKMTARFAPTPLRVDTSSLSAGDKQALVKLIEAARIWMMFFCSSYGAVTRRFMPS